MTTEETDALVAAMQAAEGFPPPTAREYAARVSRQLNALGYTITRSAPPPVLRIIGYPCTCATQHGCLEHPFSPVIETRP